MQFQYNSNYPSSPQAADPPDFPPADPHPCARLTTRVYHPSRNEISTVQNVLVRTMMPAATLVRTMDSLDSMQSSSSSCCSSSSSSDDGQSSNDENNNDNDDNDDSMQDESLTPVKEELEERAYWMQRTIREAIYGRVLYAVVLKKRKRGADWEVTTEQCAIKEMSWQHIRKERDRLAEDPIKEVSAMQFLKKWHEVTGTIQESSLNTMLKTNIMMPLDLLSDDRHLYSVMPFCDGGELFERLDLNERFCEEETRYWMHQVLNVSAVVVMTLFRFQDKKIAFAITHSQTNTLQGLENMQRAGICHRDMSLENLLVHQNGCLVIDLGMCLRVPFYTSQCNGDDKLSDTMNRMSITIQNCDLESILQRKRVLVTPQGTCGKWIYMSPEIYNNKEAFDGFAIDMWAAGVILFLMLTGFPPWERACATDDRFKYMTAGYMVQMLTEWELGLSSDAMDLLQRMLWLDPKDRLSLEQVRAHPWMANAATAVMPLNHTGI
jgi:serine/threonine protein kinase